jgi:hypothetical protein
MAVRQVRLRRGTTAENDAFTGAIGEVTVDTQTSSIRVHDGANAGGTDLMRADMSNNSDVVGNINFTNDDHTIGGAIDGGNTLTIGQAGTAVSIPGTLTVANYVTENDLLIQDKVIVLADGTEGAANSTDSIGLLFTRTLSGGGGAQDPALLYWDEAADTFRLQTNNVTEADADWTGGTNTDLTLSTLYATSGVDLNEQDITNVGDIALDSISADGNTIGMTLKQAGGATAFTIIDNDGAGANTFLTIDATDGADKLTIGATNFEVSSTTVFNEAGADVDFRVEGTGKANALFVQGSDGFVGINKAVPSVQLDVVGDTLITGSTTLEGAVVINDTGADVDFRVEGATDTDLLFVDASADSVGISTATPSKTLDVAGTFGVSNKSTLAGSLDLTTGSATGITFRSEIAENGASADQVLVRVNDGGTDGGGNPNFENISWDTNPGRFTLSANTQVLEGGLVLGNGANVTTISVPTQTDLNTAGETLTVSAGIGNGAGAGGSLIFQTGGANAGALSTVLTLDSANLATFTGDIDFSDGTTLGASVGNGHTMTLGGHAGSTVAVAGDLSVAGNDLSFGNGATIVNTDANTLTITEALVALSGDLKVSGNDIQQSDGSAVITFSGDGNKTTTLAGNLSVTTSISTEDVLTVKGGDITLGKANGANTTISVPTTDQGGAGYSLTLSSGVGSAGNSTNDGSLVLRTGATTVLTLDTNEKATFAGDIDFSNGTTLGASVVAGQTMTLGGNATSIVAVAGDLQVTGNTIKSSGADAIELSGADVDILGTLEVSGNIIKNAQSEDTITLDNNQNVTIGNNLTINGTSLASEAAADVLTVFSDNTGGITLGNTGTITLGATTGLTTVGGTLRLNDNSIENSAGTDVITLTAASTLVTLAGAIKVSGNAIQDSAGTSVVSFAGDSSLTTLTATLTALSGDLKLGGNTIQSSGGNEAIQLSGANVATKGDLTIEGRDLVLGTATAGDVTISVPTETTVDETGHNLTISAGIGNGTGAGGSLFFQTGGANGGALSTALSLNSSNVAAFAGNVTISGDLTVNGATTTVDTVNLTVEDPVIQLNKNSPADNTSDIGLYMERGNEASAIFFWDEGDTKFKLGTTTSVHTETDFGATTTLGTLRLGSLESTSGIVMDGGSFTVDSVNSDFVISDAGVLTSKNTASFNKTSVTALSVGNDNGAAFALKVDTTNLEVETANIIPLADNTHNIGAVGNIFSTGYFSDLQIATATATGALTLGGTSTFSGATPLNIKTTATNGITFRSNADADVLGGADAVLIRVAEGDTTFSSLSWDDSFDGFSFSSNVNSVGDLSVGTVGAETFVVSAASGNVKIEGDITTASDENKAIFAGVTTAGKKVAIGGGTEVVVETGEVRLLGNVIQNAQSEDTITLDNDQNVTIANNLKVDGNVIQSSGGDNTITLSDDDMTVLGNVIITGTGAGDDLTLGAGADAISNLQVKSRTAGGDADLDGGDLYLSAGGSVGTGAGGSIFLRTSITGGVSNNVANAFATVLELDTAKKATFAGAIEVATTSVLTGDVTFGGHIVADADEAKNIFTAVTTEGNFITLGGGGTVVTGGKLRLTGDVIEASDGGQTITLDTDDNVSILGDLTVKGYDIALGVDEAQATATLKPVATTAGANDGHNLTISSGVGGSGTSGTLTLGTGANSVLELDSDKKASFTGTGIDLITLNSAEVGVNNTANAGITVQRGTGDTANASIFYDEANGNTWKVNRGEGTGNEIVLTEKDTLFTFDVDGGVNTLSIEQTDGTTVLFKGAADADNQGLIFDIDNNNITLSFENTVKMPGALTLGGDLTSVNVVATNELFGPKADLTNSLEIRSSSDNSSAKTAILLNSNQAGVPAATEDVSIVVERGDSTNASLTWDEGDDRWTLDQGDGEGSNAIVTVKRSEGARPETVGTSNNGGGGDLEFTALNALDLTAQQPTAYENEHIYFLDNNSTSGTVDLFALAGTTYNGYKINFVNIDTVDMVVDANGAQTINGQLTQTIPSGGNLTLVAFGTSWYIL